MKSNHFASITKDQQRTLLSFLVISLLSLSSCSGIETIPTHPTIQVTDTPSLFSTTKSPTSTFPLPTITPSLNFFISPTLPLSPVGPYLVHPNLGKQAFMFLGKDGVGGKEIPLPGIGYGFRTQHALSPDGQWLAYYQLKDESSATQPLANYYLTLINIEESTRQIITPLFPDGFEKPDSYNCAFDIFGPEWSPDGSMLAFAGSLDGVILNLYIYEMATGIIQRIFKEAFPCLEIEWSPDGKMITVESISDPIEGEYPKHQRYIIDPHLPEIQTPRLIDEASWVFGMGWIEPDVYLLGMLEEGGGPSPIRHLYSVNARTGQKTVLWEPEISCYIVDQWKSFDQEVTILVSNIADEEPTGTYIVHLNGESKKISDKVFHKLNYRGGTNSEFIGFGSSEVVLIKPDGNIETISEKTWLEFVEVSPDENWFVLWGYDEADLFSKNNHLVRSINVYELTGVVWRPDSQGLFLIADGLYYVTIPNGEPVLVENWDSSCFFCDTKWGYTWIP